MQRPLRYAGDVDGNGGVMAGEHGTEASGTGDELLAVLAHRLLGSACVITHATGALRSHDVAADPDALLGMIDRSAAEIVDVLHALVRGAAPAA